MTKFESPIRNVPFSQQRVYDKLSDLNNLSALKDRVPEDKIKNLQFDSDHVTFDVPAMGEMSLEVVERTPVKCIKFGSVKSPIPFNFWVQIVPVSEEECKIRLTAGLEVNVFMKGIVAKPVQEGLDKVSEILSMIQY
jgi:hypothetical protein